MNLENQSNCGSDAPYVATGHTKLAAELKALKITNVIIVPKYLPS